MKRVFFNAGGANEATGGNGKQPIVNDPNAEQQTPTVANSNAPPASKLEITLPDGVRTVEVNDVISENKADQSEAVKQHIRCAVLKQFNVREIAKTPLLGGKLYMNGNRTGMILPKVKLLANGDFAETYSEYFKRALPNIATWLRQSVQNSAITMEEVTTLI